MLALYIRTGQPWSQLAAENTHREVIISLIEHIETCTVIVCILQVAGNAEFIPPHSDFVPFVHKWTLYSQGFLAPVIIMA